MKISYTYRGQATTLCSDSCNAKLSVNGEVVINQRAWSDGNQKVHKVIIQADELLNTAKACLQQLSEISGVKYKIAVTVGGSTDWLERTE